VVQGKEGALSLCFGGAQLVSLQGLALDAPALNQLLFSLRHRRPRQR
jgi:hypothetical protein